MLDEEISGYCECLNALECALDVLYAEYAGDSIPKTALDDMLKELSAVKG